MEKGKKRKNTLERIAEMFELPGEALAGMPRLILTGDRRIYIEGHRGVLEYGTCRICINCGAAILKVRGVKLEIVSMNAEDVLITGIVQGLDFE